MNSPSSSLVCNVEPRTINSAGAAGLQTISKPTKVLALWFSLSTVAVMSGALAYAPPMILPLLIFGTVGVLTVCYFKRPAFHQWVASIPTAVLMLPHLVRAPVGFQFMRLQEAGDLTPVFALNASYGDMAAGLIALLLLLSGVPLTRRNGLLRAWSILGLLDLMVVVATAQYTVFFGEGVEALLPLTRFPLAYLPTFIVPVVIFSHIVILHRLKAKSEQT